MKIQKVQAREILDSRGTPTIETQLYLDDGSWGLASVPSGVILGKYDSVELRDNDPNRFQGKGVLKAVDNVNKIIGPALIGKDASYQSQIDQLMINLDGTKNKAKLGANAILSVSQAVCISASRSFNLPVYQYLWKKYGFADKSTKMATPIINLINGGKHGAGNLDFQEFHVIPSTRKPFHQALECGDEIYQALRSILVEKNAIHSVGDEGGFAPNLFTNIDALELLMDAIRHTKYQFAKDVFIGLDVAADSFYKAGKYYIRDRADPLKPEELIDYYVALDKDYHLFSLEDALQQDDWDGWTTLTQLIGSNTVIVGDDLLSTNEERILKAIEKKACSSILVKPNQIGTITETLRIIQICKKAGWQIIVSHRSGETADDFIADLAIGVGAEYTKFGAPARGERIAKYNRLLKIEQEISTLK